MLTAGLNPSETVITGDGQQHRRATAAGLQIKGLRRIASPDMFSKVVAFIMHSALYASYSESKSHVLLQHMPESRPSENSRRGCGAAHNEARLLRPNNACNRLRKELHYRNPLPADGFKSRRRNTTARKTLKH